MTDAHFQDFNKTYHNLKEDLSKVDQDLIKVNEATNKIMYRFFKML